MSARMKFPGDEFVRRMHIEFVVDDVVDDGGHDDDSYDHT